MKLSTRIPFAGFYESMWSAEIDQAQEQMLDRESLKNEFPELSVMPDHDIDMQRLNEALWYSTDNRAVEAKIGEAFVDGFASWLQESLNLEKPIKIEFEEISSPKFYNFETDRIFAKLPEGIFRLMRTRLAKEAPGALSKQFYGMFTSRSGFMSHYSNRVPEKPLREWDHNELYALVCAWVEHANDGESLDWSIYEDMHETVYNAVSEGTDWDKMSEAAAEMAADWLAEQVDFDPTFIPPAPRCAYTMELPGIRG